MTNSLDQILSKEDQPTIGRLTRYLLILTLAVFAMVGGVWLGKSQTTSDSFTLPAGFDPTALSAGLIGASPQIPVTASQG